MIGLFAGCSPVYVIGYDVPAVTVIDSLWLPFSTPDVWVHIFPATAIVLTAVPLVFGLSSHFNLRLTIPVPVPVATRFWEVESNSTLTVDASVEKT